MGPSGVHVESRGHDGHLDSDVNIRVDRPLGESYAGRDTQLDAAVKELLAEIDAGGGRETAASGQQ